MARIRSIKPSFFRSRSVKKLSDKAKLVWIALWVVADDEGRLLDELGILTGDLWALGLSEPRLDKVLDELHAQGRIVRYEVAGQGFIEVTGWDHQKINRPTESLLPPVPLTESSVSPHVLLTVGGEGKGKEGRGETPTPFCVKHPGGTEKPCTACKLARIAFDTSAPAAKPTLSGMVTPAQCREHGYPAGECPTCDLAVAS